MAFLILLSPSKTQEAGHYSSHHTEPEFILKTKKIVDKLKNYSAAELASLMDMSDKLGEVTFSRYRQFHFPPSSSLSSVALLGFRGDVFAEIDADNYEAADFEFAQKHLRVLSGLYGLLRPLDLIQPYRLEIGGKFRPEPDTSLYQYWKSDITTAIAARLKEMTEPVLLNLASAEYLKAVDLKNIPAPVVTAVFKQRKNGKLRTVAIHAKKARGAMTDFIIKNKITETADLQIFSYGGYSYDSSSSSKSELHFISE